VVAAKAAERERAQLLFTKGLASIEDTERAIRAIDAEDMACRALLASLDADAAALEATARQLDRTELLVGSLLPLVEAGDAGDRAARRHVIETLVREIAVVTTTGPRTRRRQKRDPTHVHVVIRYRHAPAPDRRRCWAASPRGWQRGCCANDGHVHHRPRAAAGDHPERPPRLASPEGGVPWWTTTGTRSPRARSSPSRRRCATTARWR
jgi:hypothetical protein